MPVSRKRPPLIHYKVGLCIVGLFGFIFLLVVADQATAAKHDAATQKTAHGIANKLNDYIDRVGVIPYSLTATGARQVPSSISYKKLSGKAYRFCVTYDAQKSNTGSSVSTIFGGDYPNNYTDPSYLYIPDSHHKGENCQTIKPDLSYSLQLSQPKSPYVKNSDGSYTVCGVATNYFDGEGHVTQALSASNTISLSSTAYPYTGAQLLFVFSASSKAFDERCNPLTATDIHVGDTVSVFDITSPNAPAVSIFLKRSY